MKSQDKIRSVVARFFNVSEAEVTDSFQFPASRLQGSVGRSTLHAALKRLADADLKSVWEANTFGELVNSASDLASTTVTESQQSKRLLMSGNDFLSGFTVGIDLEDVSNLPMVNDPWNQPFYAENFTPEEIAYAARQTDSRLTFCGLWSAKESIIKLGDSFRELKPLEIQINHDVNRRPFAVVGGESLAGTVELSISHTTSSAVAVSIKIGVTNATQAVGIEAPVAVPAPTAKDASPTSNRLTLAFAIAGFLLAVYAVVHTR